MKVKIKQSLCLLLCLLLIFGQTSFAANKLKKEEVIYSKLDFSGGNELLIAVNGFPKGFSGEDFGDYSEVTNLSTKDELEYKEGKLKIHAKENFYYQGKLKTKELPWLITMKWKLDGKDVTQEELLGKSGLLSLDYEIKKNPKVSQDYYERYVLQSSFYFKVDQVGSIKAPEGTLAVAGSSKLVNFMSLPGKGGHYTLEAEVTKYEPGMVQIAALPLNFAMDMSELNQFTGELKTLEMAIAQISGGTNSLVQGLGKTYDGSKEFGSSGERILSGGKSMRDGLDELRQGSGAIQEGLGDYAQGMNRFRDGILLLTQGLDQLQEHLPLLQERIGELPEGVRQYVDGVKALSEGIKTFHGKTEPLEQGVKDLGDGLWKLVVAGKGDPGASPTEEPNNLIDASKKFQEAFQLLRVFENFEITEEQAQVILHAIAFMRDTLIPTLTQIDQDKLLEIIAALDSAHIDLETTISSLKGTRDQLLFPVEYSASEGEDPELIAKVAGHYKEQMSERAGELTEQISRLEMIDNSLLMQQEAARLFHEYFGTLESSFNQFKAFLENIEEILKKMDLDKDKILQLNQQLKKLTRGYDDFHQGLVDYVNGVELLHQAVAGEGVDGNESLLHGITAMREAMIKDLYGAGSLLADKGENELYQGVLEFSEKILALVKELNAFGDQKDILEGGVTKLDDGAALLYENYRRFHGGLQELSSGLGEFYIGLGQYVHGFWGLSDGLRQLYEGGLTLNDGTSLLAKETTNIDKQMLDKIKEYLDEFSSENYVPKSFLSGKNQDVKSVHFVMVYEGKTLPVEENTEEVAEPTTFWEKLLNIFK